MLSSPLELLIDFTKRTFETPRIDREDCTGVPHFTHTFCEGLHKLTVMTHHIIWIHLLLVRWMLFVSNFD